MNKDIRVKLIELGADIYVKELGGERRIRKNESWRVFTGDLLVWFNSELFIDDNIPIAIEILKLIPRLKFLKISGCKITGEGYNRMKMELSYLNIEFTELTDYQ